MTGRREVAMRLPRTSPVTAPLCPRCGRARGLLLDRPSYGAFNAVYRCNTREGGCGYLWSPAAAR